MFELIVALIVIGVVLYLVQLIPMDATIKRIITILVILVVIIWVISLILPPGSGWYWPRHRLP